MHLKFSEHELVEIVQRYVESTTLTSFHRTKKAIVTNSFFEDADGGAFQDKTSFVVEIQTGEAHED